MRLAIIILASALFLPLLHIPTASASCDEEHGQTAVSCTITHMISPGATTCNSCGVPVAQLGLVLLLVAGFIVFLTQEQSGIFVYEHAPPLPPPKV